ncbi:MAG: DUF1254 domain-containing protein [Gammaproteobacteria bacterium]|nr:DUF1254 domain-containing protein [Gammaproteobacteria bacterium]
MSPAKRPANKLLIAHLVALLLVATAAHVLTVWALPRLIMVEVLRVTGAEGSRSADGVLRPPPADHTARRIVMPSPDLLYATCSLDISTQPAQISANIDYPRYWSIALYADNSDNFMVRNDRQQGTQALRWWVVTKDAKYPVVAAPGVEIIEAPGSRVLLLLRMLLPEDAAGRAAAEAARNTLHCR